jgi:hypothetical protein
MAEMDGFQDVRQPALVSSDLDHDLTNATAVDQIVGIVLRPFPSTRLHTLASCPDLCTRTPRWVLHVWDTSLKTA